MRNPFKKKPVDAQAIKPGAVKSTSHINYVELVRKLTDSGGVKINVFKRTTHNGQRTFGFEQTAEATLEA
jgi:hypothetical protein